MPFVICPCQLLAGLRLMLPGLLFRIPRGKLDMPKKLARMSGGTTSVVAGKVLLVPAVALFLSNSRLATRAAAATQSLELRIAVDFLFARLSTYCRRDDCISGLLAKITAWLDLLTGRSCL